MRSRARLLKYTRDGRLDAVRAVAEVHVVAVEGEDLALRVALLDLDREDRFLDLPLPRLVERQEQVPGELLRQRARARALAVDDVARRRDHDARNAQAEVAVEPRILRGHDGVPQRHRDVVVADDDPPLGRELADDVAVERLEARDRARCVVVERGDLRQVVAVREQQAGNRAGDRREDEQRDDAGAAGKADDETGHSVNSGPENVPFSGVARVAHPLPAARDGGGPAPPRGWAPPRGTATREPPRSGAWLGRGSRRRCARRARSFTDGLVPRSRSPPVAQVERTPAVEWTSRAAGLRTADRLPVAPAGVRRWRAAGHRAWGAG